MKTMVVCCDGAPNPPGARKLRGAKKLAIRSRGPTAKLNLRVQPISDSLGVEVAGRAEDLVRIASYAYWADQMVSRGGAADLYGDDWKRNFFMSVPVSDPDFWNAEPIRQRLEDALVFASDDNWLFHFAKAEFPQQLTLGADPLESRKYPDSVLLFSGGTDSLCATVEAVARQGTRPILVSHHSASYIDHRQEQLVSGLREALGGKWFLPRLSLLVNKASSRERDTAQRTRSFLFASLAAGVASALGLSRVILADNGVVSLNLPVNDQLLGALASRSTHPKFLRLFNELARVTLPHRPQLENPLWNRTRAEALEVLKKANVRELLQESNSCSRARGLPNATPHCGTCSQCVDRRFASMAAGLENYDLPELYRQDIFCGELAGDALTMAASYHRHALRVHSLTEEGLFSEFPQLEDCILTDDPDPGGTAMALARLEKRHADEVLQVAADQVEMASKDLVLQQLPPTCLIRISVGAGKPSEPKPSVPEIKLSAHEEESFRVHRFKSRHIIQITGETEARKSNVLRINDAEVFLTDSQFRLFLRFVVALFETDNGYVTRESLKYGEGADWDGELAPEGLDQAISRIRTRIRPALKDTDPTAFIECHRKRARISTHMRYVFTNREKLLNHDDPIIRLLAERLPVKGRHVKSMKRAPAPA